MSFEIYDNEQKTNDALLSEVDFSASQHLKLWTDFQQSSVLEAQSKSSILTFSRYMLK